MRILFIHEVNYLDKVIFEMHEFPELLALAGHQVTFLHYPENARSPVRSLRSTFRRVAGRVHPEARITLATPPTFGGHGVERLVAPLTSLPLLHRLIRPEKYDLIVLYAVPTTGWQTVSIARRRGVPVVFRALDVSHRIRETALAPLIKVAERHVYRTASAISANNPAMADYCRGIAGPGTPITVDVPPVDFAHFDRPLATAERDEMRSSLGLGADDRVIAYMGSFFSFSGLDVLVTEMAELFTRDPGLRLLLIGDGELMPELRRLVRELDLGSRVLFTGIIDYDVLPRYLKAADVAVNPFRKELTTEVAFPHKVLQYMAAGVPAVSTRLAGLRGVLGDRAGVMWVAGPEGVARAAAELARESDDRLAQIAETQFHVVHRLFDRDTAVASFERTLEAAR